MTLLIHIGYQKTASTWLQSTLFSSSSGIFCEPCKNGYAEAYKNFIYGKEFHFNANQSKKLFEPGILSCKKKGLVPVISNENLVGNPNKPYDYAKTTAEKIFQTFPSAKILIFIREQTEMIASLYRQHLKDGGTDTLDEYLGRNYQQTRRLPRLISERLEYDQLISYYFDLFGKENVLVLSYDDFKKAKKHLLTKLLFFVNRDDDIDVFLRTEKLINFGSRGLSVEVNRYLNYILPTFPKPGVPKSRTLNHRAKQFIVRKSGLFVPQTLNDNFEHRMMAKIQDFVGERYIESNKRTYNLSGVQIGYTPLLQ